MALTDAQYDVADTICTYLEAHPDRDYTASQLARAAKVTVTDVYPVLDHLVRAQDGVRPTGRGGMWRRYAHRPLHTPYRED